MFEGLMATLRPVGPQDHPVLAAIRADAALQQMLLGAPEPSAEPVGDWVARRARDGWIRTIAGVDDACAGYVQIAEIHRRDRTGWFGICLHADARGQGLGGAATAQTMAVARAELGLRKLSLKVRADNPAARLYARLGFRMVGTQQAEYFDGARCHDVHIMETMLGEKPDA